MKKESQKTIEVTVLEPTYGYATCGGGGKATDGGGCGNTVKFNPEKLPFGKCPACGVIWMLSDDDTTAESTFDEAVYANVSMFELGRSGRPTKPIAI